MMIDVLHEMFDLTGSRLGCGQGICHACVVIWDRDDQTSEEVPTCITGAHFFDGKRIRTIEGIARTNDKGEIVSTFASATGVPGSIQLPVRLLHTRVRQCCDGVDRAAATRAHRARRGRSNRRRGVGEAHLPLHRICAVLSRGPRFDPGDARADAGRRMILRRLIWVGCLPAVAGIGVLAFASINLMNGKSGGAVQIAMRLRTWLRAENIWPKRRTVPRVIPRRAARHLPAAWRCRAASA